jgi:hypothetical protein
MIIPDLSYIISVYSSLSQLPLSASSSPFDSLSVILILLCIPLLAAFSHKCVIMQVCFASLRFINLTDRIKLLRQVKLDEAFIAKFEVAKFVTPTLLRQQRVMGDP